MRETIEKLPIEKKKKRIELGGGCFIESVGEYEKEFEEVKKVMEKAKRDVRENPDSAPWQKEVLEIIEKFLKRTDRIVREKIEEENSKSKG